MTQIGTMAFNAEASPCQSTIVSLTASVTNNILGSIGAALDGDVAKAADTWTDGYSMSVTMTMGQQALANSISQTCFNSVKDGATKAAICFQAKAGDEDGMLAAGGVSARWIAASNFKAEGNPQQAENQGVIGDKEGFSSSPAAAWRGAKNDKGTYEGGSSVKGGLNMGAKVSAKWYQPSASK